MKQNIPQPLIIKKYENRRLYNTLTSQYINQGQVAQLVRDGHDVRVVDAATGQDLTRLVLAQIVLEDAKTPDSVFPLDVLRQMILASGRATQENALRYMKAMMDMYQNASRALPPPMNPFEFLQGNWAKPVAGNGPIGGPQSQPDFPEASETQVKASEAVELKRRIEELESLLIKRVPKKSKGRPKSRRKA
ncbi:MAG TPA: polyhydroxyalkanoate synthesis regulator DNA-binding domain-containing protein [Terriglobales bacterium]|nr:polyhydroxyalkanoate synthesis regulator DNA-binding domain-containing protein [Terriglobales bacterium]